MRVEGEIIDTTVGRLIFNEVLPSEIGFINRTIDKGDIKKITADVHRLLGNRQTAEFVDSLKRVGYNYATMAGITISIDDVVTGCQDGPHRRGSGRSREDTRSVRQRYHYRR